MATALLLLHAFPLDGSMWQPQIDALGQARPKTPVLAPSYPGFRGGDPLTAPVLTMDAAADAAVRALDRAGIDQALVVGLSMGGYVALAFWRRHRTRVAGFVFANTRAVADDEAGKARRRALAARLQQEGSGFLVENPPALLAAPSGAPAWQKVKAIIAAQPAEAIAAASLGMADRPDSTADLPGINVPTVVIGSSGDTLIPPEATEPMARAIPGARYVLIGAGDQGGPVGHVSNLEAPSRFGQLLIAELDALDRAAR